MAAVDSHDCNLEMSGCVRGSFLVCFWYELSAAWKIAWKLDSEEAEAEVVAWVDDMTRACELACECHGGGLGGSLTDYCEHWVEGKGQKNRLMASLAIISQDR